jgi:glutamate:Na+ symporter, ESS family
VFLGSAAFLGGHGTTAAWAGQELAASAKMPSTWAWPAPRSAWWPAACSAAWSPHGCSQRGPRARRRHVRGAGAWRSHAAQRPADDACSDCWTSSDRWLRQLLVLSLTIGLALTWQAWLAGRGINVPPFLACLLTAVVFTNLADLLKHGVDLETSDLVGTVALRLFLAMSLMSLDLMAVLRCGRADSQRTGAAVRC